MSSLNFIVRAFSLEVKERAVNRLPRETQAQVVNALCQGMSLRAITRLLGVHRTTVMRILERTGPYCEALCREYMRDLDMEEIQVDEIWTFCRKKQGHLSVQEKNDWTIGDQYVFMAIDRKSKLIPTWVIGKRNTDTTYQFIERLKGCMIGCRTQISSDAFGPYADAIEMYFGRQADYAIVTKNYEGEPVGRGRYAPPHVSSVSKHPESGRPNLDRACTSHIERTNLTLRTFQQRFTRLTLGFSKKLENLQAACALHFAYYNFVWIPRTQRVSPAMAAKVTDRLWDIADLVPND